MPILVYVSAAGLPEPPEVSVMPVDPGDTVYVIARARAGATPDARGRWPHILYKPGGIDNRKGEPQFKQAFSPQEPPSFRDDGALAVPFPGQVYVTGGVGTFDIDFGYARNLGCERQTRFPWKLTHYSDGLRVNVTNIPRGAQWVEFTQTTDVILHHGAVSEALPTTPAGVKVYLQSVTRIEFQPAAIQGQMIIHGII